MNRFNFKRPVAASTLLLASLIYGQDPMRSVMTMGFGNIATLKCTGSLPQNVSYALKSRFISAFLETGPEVSPKL
jgi:hypothetical protein